MGKPTKIDWDIVKKFVPKNFKYMGKGFSGQELLIQACMIAFAGRMKGPDVDKLRKMIQGEITFWEVG